MAGKQKPIRIGLVGAGQNTRYKHIPGLLAQEGVELVAVANRRRASSERVARDYGIARVCEHWRQVVEADDLDAIVIGTWPYLHCPVTLAALAAGKHVLTEARMAMNLAEAEMMLAASPSSAPPRDPNRPRRRVAPQRRHHPAAHCRRLSR